MSKSLDEALKKIVSTIGLNNPKESYNNQIVSNALNQIKRAYIQHADYSDIELIIRDHGEAELMEIQGVLDEALAKYREENP